MAKYTDLNGVVTYGPYLQSDVQLLAGFTVDVTNFSALNSYGKYLHVSEAANVTINSSNRIVHSDYHNYTAGDRLLVMASPNVITINSPKNSITVELEVESVVANTSVTFTAASMVGVSIDLIGISTYKLDRRCEYVIAISKTQDTGYYIADNLAASPLENGLFISDLHASSEQFVISDAGFADNTLVPLEDIYDTTTGKQVPPICSYLASIGSQIVYGNITGLYDFNNQLSIYKGGDIIMYSDVNSGDTVESLTSTNVQKIGETWDGDISGLRRCNDSMIVFKDRGIFSLDGTLISGQYSLRKINTNNVGCTANRSILATDEGLLFQAHNGLYFTNGIGIKKITYEVDNLFLSGTYTDTRSVCLKKKQKSLFYVPSIAVGSNKIVVIDYYYNQVYVWNNIAADLGFMEDITGNVYFFNSSGLFKMNDSYTDNGSAITSSYSTTWHHAGEPSLNKKWLSMRMFSLTDASFTAAITTQGDWDTTVLTTNSLSFSSTDQTKFIMLDMKTKRSFRVTFTNAVNNENMVITGYELTYEPFNVVDKN